MEKDTKQKLDDLAMDLQREIKRRFGEGGRIKATVAIGVAYALERLNYHFDTNYEEEIDEIMTSDLGPIRKYKEMESKTGVHTEAYTKEMCRPRLESEMGRPRHGSGKYGMGP